MSKTRMSEAVAPIRDRNITPILGVNLDSSPNDSLLTRAWSSLKRESVKKPFFIITPNPEIVYRASNNKKYRHVLNQADLAVPDGVGLGWALRFCNKKSQVVPGRLFVLKMVEDCVKNRQKVFLLGGESGVAEMAAKKLRVNYKSLIIDFDSGFWLNTDGEPISDLDYKKEKLILKKINKFGPALLVVCFGPPKQEYWIYKNLGKLRVNVVIGAGGTLDYLAGIKPLPPKIFEVLGFEWVWRLITQPYRAPRIFTAVVLFPLKFLLSKK